MYSVQFVGLVCFLREQGGRHLLLPDGRNPGDGIDPHYASIVVAPDAVEEAVGWNEPQPKPGTFELVPCTISLQGADQLGPLDTSEHQGLLPELRRIDPNFEIDPSRAATIAQLHVRRGTLKAYRIPGGTALISQLDVPYDESIQITITPTDGSAVRTIKVRPGTEIALTNNARNYLAETEEEPNGHFQIYEKLSVHPVSLKDPVRVPDVPPSPSRHAMFLESGPISLSYNCSNTGCC